MTNMKTASAVSKLLSESNKVNLVAASSAINSYALSCMREIDFQYVAEGYVGGRFHEGGELLDELETIASNNTKKVFGDTDVIVQAWRCTNAIVATCFALAKQGDTILGLSCASGGYYATGSSSAHFLSKIFNIKTYDVDERTHLLDYDALEEAVRDLRPKIIFAGDTSYSRHWNWNTVRQIAKSYDSYLVADISQHAGLIAAGLYPSPFPYADVVLFATYKTLRGPKGAVIAMNGDDVSARIKKSLYPGTQGSCCATTIAGIAATMEFAQTQEFKDYAKRVIDTASHLADGLMDRGLHVISGGTENHSFIIEIPDGTMKSAKDVCRDLSNIGILTNATPIPYDKRPLKECSGIRVGTTAVATQAMDIGFLDQLVDDIASGVRRSLK